VTSSGEISAAISAALHNLDSARPTFGQPSLGRNKTRTNQKEK